jgi:hypothetical protein
MRGAGFPLSRKCRDCNNKIWYGSCIVVRGNTDVRSGGADVNKVNFKIAGIFAVIAIVAVMFGSGTLVSGVAHFFNAAAVGVFVVASTVGLATRLRA